MNNNIVRNLHRSYLTVFPQTNVVTPRAHGLDISKYDLFFKPLTAAGQLDFVIQRVSYRVTRDELFASLVEDVMSVPVRGAYHYLNSDVDWRTQADAFLSFVSGYEYHFFACDFEGAFNDLSPAFAYQAWQWIHYIAGRTNRPVLLYTSPSLYSNFIVPSQPRYGIDWNTVLFWTAQWFYTPNPNGTPSMPPGRTAGWTFWQYTDQGNGPLYGVSRPTACDLDVFNGTPAQLRDWLKIEEPTNPPDQGEGETMQVIKGTAKGTVKRRKSPAGAEFFPPRYLYDGDQIEASGNENQWLHLSKINGALVTDEEWASAGSSEQYISWEWVDATDPEPEPPPITTYPDLPYTIVLGDDVNYEKATISGVLKPKR